MRTTRYFLMVTVCAWLAGCAAMDGTFEPACAAFAGDRIEITGDRFVWKKFTDEVVVSADGELMEQSPGFPANGSVLREGKVLKMVRDDGSVAGEFVRHQRNGQQYLLTKQQDAAVNSDATLWECALRQRTQ